MFSFFFLLYLLVAFTNASIAVREDKLQRAKDLRKEESEQALSLAKYNFEGICAER